MNKLKLFFLFQFIAFSLVAQSNEENARLEAKEAIKIMDEGRIEESIKLLEEGQKRYPENYIFPYEIAYAQVLKKDYAEAISILKKVKKYKSINSQVYQMLGNCYSYSGKPKKAIKEYDEGIKHFPNAGNLYLEKGNIHLFQKNYEEAIANYEKGIEVDPNYASNYFRLAKIFLNSSDKLSGLIYGELFMNIERTTARTQEMSELLFNSYQTAITLGETESKIDFCEIIIDASQIEENEEFELPFCAIFGKNFILTIMNEKEINLNSLSAMRKKFLENYFQEDHETHPNILFQYQKEMLDKGLLEAYTHYLFQMGAEEEFNKWVEENSMQYEAFVDWYTLNENILRLTETNKFIR